MVKAPYGYFKAKSLHLDPPHQHFSYFNPIFRRKIPFVLPSVPSELLILPGENRWKFMFFSKKTYIFPIFTVNIPCFPVFFWWPPSPKAAAQRPSEARSSCWRRCVRRRSRAEKASKGQSLTMEISSPNYSHSYLARDYWNSHEIPTIILNRNTIYREYHGNTIGI